MIAIRIEEPVTYEEKDRPAVVRNARHIEKRFNALPADEQVAILRQIAAALNEPVVADAESEMIARLTGGRIYTSGERAELALTVLQRSFARRRELLEGAITAPQVAKLIGVSRQTPHDRLEKGTLLAVSDQGKPMFPLWQFDPAGPNSVVEGLPSVTQALHATPLGKVRWLTRANAYLDGRTPLEALKQGERERVVKLAEAVGVN